MKLKFNGKTILEANFSRSCAECSKPIAEDEISYEYGYAEDPDKRQQVCPECHHSLCIARLPDLIRNKSDARARGAVG